MERIIIGVDPHKLSATIEVVDDHERKTRAAAGSPPTRSGYAAMLTYVQGVAGADVGGRGRQRRSVVRWRSGCSRPVQDVVDVPAKLAARVRLFDTGHNRKTDAHDAHSIAMVAVRTQGLRMLRPRR